MKKILFILIVISLLPICASAQQSYSRTEKAKALIRNEFKENMNDYNSYSPVSYSKVDSLFSDIQNDPTFSSTLEIAKQMETLTGVRGISVWDNLIPVIDKLKNDMEAKKMDGDERLLQNLRHLLTIQYSLKKMIREYQPIFLGWKITHKYRAKNAYNAIMIYEQEFQFDKGMSKITSIKNIDNKAR